MTIRFERRTCIAAPADVVFDVALDIDQHLESMAPFGERAVGGVSHGRIGLHEEVTWKATHFGVPFTMTSRVIELDRPRRFVDRQVRGPFHAFRHEHSFEPVDGGTAMIDRVRFTAPAGPVGWFVERVWLDRHLRQLIELWGGGVKVESERRAA